MVAQDESIEWIGFQGTNIAIIIKSQHKHEGLEFITDAQNSLQVAYMQRKKGEIIKSHIHNKVVRTIEETQEVLIVKRGLIRVELFSGNGERVAVRTLSEGDTIILLSGGHGFYVIEDAEMLEVKQGPYVGNMDKVLLNIPEGQLR